jgi:hypothetical protein
MMTTNPCEIRQLPLDCHCNSGVNRRYRRGVDGPGLLHNNIPKGYLYFVTWGGRIQRPEGASPRADKTDISQLYTDISQSKTDISEFWTGGRRAPPPCEVRRVRAGCISGRGRPRSPPAPEQLHRRTSRSWIMQYVNICMQCMVFCRIRGGGAATTHYCHPPELDAVDRRQQVPHLLRASSAA